MAAFNLENNIREKLENRELKPSPNAWKKLESQLDENGGNRNRNRMAKNWYYIAASLVGVLLAVSVFFNRNTVEVENEIVTENTIQRDVLPTETEIATELSDPSKEKEFTEQSKIKSNQTTEYSKPQPVQKESEVEKKRRKSEALATISKEENGIDSEKAEDPIIKEDPVFNAKVDEVVASVKSLQQRNEEITVEEVETLLENARRKIQAEKILRNQKVDATALLEDVEWELERDFRDKIFDVLGEGFNKLRTAISQRND